MNEWIDVKEKLPETDSVVLIAHTVRGGGVLCPNGDYVWFARHNGDRWLRGDGYLWPEELNANITHWMPLPDPPN